jgi:large subunit ribosomal protein L14
MIQVGTKVKVIDNSGSKVALCFKIIYGFKKRYGFVGDLIKVSIKKLRNKRRSLSRTKKGEIHTGLIIRTKKEIKYFSGDNLMFFENSIVLLNKKNKLIGTKIFGLVPIKLRYTKFLKIASLSSGFCR